MYGGYSRVKTTATPGGKSKRSGATSKSSMKPMVHQDSWFLRIPPLPADAPSTPPNPRWERRKKPANSPDPPRVGATQAYHKGRGLLFGGVHDVEESEEGIESEFFNTLLVWNIERNRFFPLNLRRTKTIPSKKPPEDRDRRGRAKADEAELLRNLAALETKGTIQEADAMDIAMLEEEADSALSRPAKPVLNTFPHARFNAQLAVQGDTLYIFGGTYEQADHEITFAEMHAIDIGKLDGVTEIYRREPDNWQEEVDSGSDSEDDEISEDEDMEDEAASGGVALPSTMVPAAPVPEVLTVDDGESTISEAMTVDDHRPHPRPFETLRDFFARTSQTWQELVLANLHGAGEAVDQSVKELRKVAFERAETMWWDCREEVTAEEERQEEAGIGEVVSLAARGEGVGGGVGRRR